LEHFGVKKCIAMGEGAGADIICRFAVNSLKFHQQPMGLWET
jgi:hypothetical protein